MRTLPNHILRRNCINFIISTPSLAKFSSIYFDIKHKAWKHFIKKSFNSFSKSVTIVQTEPFTHKKSPLLLSSPAPGKHKFLSSSPFTESQHTLLTFSKKKKKCKIHMATKKTPNKQKETSTRESIKNVLKKSKKHSFRNKPTFDKNSKVLPSCELLKNH